MMEDMRQELRERGERRHEQCRYGRLTEAWRVEAVTLDDRPPKQTPTVMPLCMWRAPEPSPPAVKRAWGGAIEFERDCALCDAFEQL